MKQTQTTSCSAEVYPLTIEKKSPSTIEKMDASIQLLKQQKDEWAGQSITKRLAYLDMLIHDFAALAPQWVDLVTTAQNILSNDHAIGVEWMQGPYSILRNLQCLKRSLIEIQAHGFPKIPGPVTVRHN